MEKKKEVSEKFNYEKHMVDQYKDQLSILIDNLVKSETATLQYQLSAEKQARKDNAIKLDNHYITKFSEQNERIKELESQNERLLSALKEFVHVRCIDQELIDRAKQLINEIEKQ